VVWAFLDVVSAFLGVVSVARLRVRFPCFVDISKTTSLFQLLYPVFCFFGVVYYILGSGFWVCCIISYVRVAGCAVLYAVFGFLVHLYCRPRSPAPFPYSRCLLSLLACHPPCIIVCALETSTFLFTGKTIRAEPSRAHRVAFVRFHAHRVASARSHASHAPYAAIRGHVRVFS
jgi:hypothetical protein